MKAQTLPLITFSRRLDLSSAPSNSDLKMETLVHLWFSRWVRPHAFLQVHDHHPEPDRIEPRTSARGGWTLQAIAAVLTEKKLSLRLASRNPRMHAGDHPRRIELWMWMRSKQEFPESQVKQSSKRPLIFSRQSTRQIDRHGYSMLRRSRIHRWSLLWRTTADHSRTGKCKKVGGKSRKFFRRSTNNV